MTTDSAALKAIGPRFSDLGQLGERLRESAEGARRRAAEIDAALYGRGPQKDIETNQKPSGGFFNDHGSALLDAQDSLDRVNETLERILAQFGASPPPTVGPPTPAARPYDRR